MRLYLISATALLSTLAFAVPAEAITYIGNRTIQDGNVQISITTDGTLGALTAANLTDWTFSITVPPNSGGNLFGPLGAANSSVQLLGSGGLTATATQLLFDFDGRSRLTFAADNQPPFTAIGYCLGGRAANARCVNTRGVEAIANGLLNFRETTFDGIGIIASTGGGLAGVPEPSSWALMLAGFGLAGAAMRRRTIRPIQTNAAATGPSIVQPNGH